MNKTTFILNFTLSKLLGYLIFILGTIYAFCFKDGTVLIAAYGISGGLLGLKGWNDASVYKKEIENKVTPVVKPKEEIG